MRALIAVWLALAVMAAGCLDTSTGAATGGHRQQQRQGSSVKQAAKQAAARAAAKAARISRRKREKAERWHLIVTLRRQIAAVRYEVVQLSYLHRRHMHAKYPEFQIKSTAQLTRMLHKWQARLASWQGT